MGKTFRSSLADFGHHWERGWGEWLKKHLKKCQKHTAEENEMNKILKA